MGTAIGTDVFPLDFFIRFGLILTKTILKSKLDIDILSLESWFYEARHCSKYKNPLSNIIPNKIVHLFL